MRYLGGFILIMCLACGSASQNTLNTLASISLLQTQDIRSRVHLELDQSCRREHPPETSTFSDWRECMEPSYVLDRAVLSLDAAMRAAQAALDAGGEDAFLERLPHVIEMAAQLVEILEAFDIEVPEDVTNILNLRGLL